MELDRTWLCSLIQPCAAQPNFGECTAVWCPLAVLTPIQPHHRGEVSFLPP